ncbi:Histidyl-tRNA synthetase [Carpediemonas membranifera]|uniref:Histidyl-tRNA synthetase n=1 Tax=Carpediemonas membranifera TaxID=201153 RepID=A0A8J6B2K4_9EUKA|nr:Histidyl-tRNA synthetase [Carpediemonas membranifera]|eukprot:KAG9397050.1 Histidyl-tRNA synthetase [Carpediemonas membranifera]
MPTFPVLKIGELTDLAYGKDELALSSNDADEGSQTTSVDCKPQFEHVTNPASVEDCLAPEVARAILVSRFSKMEASYEVQLRVQSVINNADAAPALPSSSPADCLTALVKCIGGNGMLIVGHELVSSESFGFKTPCFSEETAAATVAATIAPASAIAALVAANLRAIGPVCDFAAALECELQPVAPSHTGPSAVDFLTSGFVADCMTADKGAFTSAQRISEAIRGSKIAFNPEIATHPALEPVPQAHGALINAAAALYSATRTELALKDDRVMPAVSMTTAWLRATAEACNGVTALSNERIETMHGEEPLTMPPVTIGDAMAEALVAYTASELMRRAIGREMTAAVRALNGVCTEKREERMAKQADNDMKAKALLKDRIAKAGQEAADKAAAKGQDEAAVAKARADAEAKKRKKEEETLAKRMKKAKPSPLVAIGDKAYRLFTALCPQSETEPTDIDVVQVAGAKAVDLTGPMPAAIELELRTTATVFKPAKGTQDYGPRQMRVREQVFQTIRRVFKQHGACEIDTPVFELRDTLMGKYGEDSKLIYDLENQGGELLSMRYDLTVPFARYVANHAVPEIRRFHIGKVYRRENPNMARGRFREFYQCDFDIAGQFGPMVADSEVITTLVDCLRALKVGPFDFKLSHRGLLDAMLTVCGVPDDNIRPICSAIDKLDKAPWSEVKEEMLAKGLAEDSADRIGYIVADSAEEGNPFIGTLPAVMKTFAALAKADEAKICEVIGLELNDTTRPKATVIKALLANKRGQAALADMRMLASYLEASGAASNVEFNISLARGLDYYTGVIYEAVVKAVDADGEEVRVGSISAGGRYDNLVGMFGKKPIPAVGGSIGVERVFRIKEAMVEKKSRAPKVDVSRVVDVFIHTDDTLADMRIAKALRAQGISCEFPYKKMGKSDLDKMVKNELTFQTEVTAGQWKGVEGDLPLKTKGDLDIAAALVGSGFVVEKNE